MPIRTARRVPTFMPSLPSRIIFPSWCLEEVKTRDEWSTRVMDSLGGEVANSNWSRPRWVVDLSGGLCTSQQRRELRAVVRLLKGRRHLCWYRRYNDPEWELRGPDGQGEWLGDADGVRTVFQARIWDSVQGRGVELPVYALDHDIEPLGEDPYGYPQTKTRFAEVRVGGVLQTLGVNYTVTREGARIVFPVPPQSGRVLLKCGFFAVMRLGQDGITMEPGSGGWWKISDGVMLVEPKGWQGEFTT